jgi:hypothetical protein
MPYDFVTGEPIYLEKLKALVDLARADERKQVALDKKAENARELGLDYEPVLKDSSNYRYDPPVAEPVAYLCENAVGHKYFRWKKPSSTYKPIALYTTPPAAQPAPVQERNFCERCGKRVGGEGDIHTCTPPAQRTWVGLTDEEIEIIYAECNVWDKFEYERMLEAKLKEKNT